MSRASEVIEIESRGASTVLRLAHGKVSALDTELLAALKEKLDEIESSAYGAVILTGSGSTFSAGVDLWRVLEGGADYLQTFLPTLNDALMALFTLGRPVIAAVNGHAVAGGCILVSACDYRIMADGPGKIGVPELRVGVPFPYVALETLRFAVGGNHLNELVYLGKNSGPARARELGLIDEIVPPDQLMDRASEIAEQMVTIPARSFQLTKREMRQPSLDRIERFASVTDPDVARAWADPEIHATIRAFMDSTVRR